MVPLVVLVAVVPLVPLVPVVPVVPVVEIDVVAYTVIKACIAMGTPRNGLTVLGLGSPAPQKSWP